MISRVADHCFWFGRYLERAESTARVLMVTRNLSSDAELTSEQCWLPVLIVSGEEAPFITSHGVDRVDDGESVERYMTWAEDNLTCIRHSLRAARENARSIRDVVSLEAWEAVNELHHWLGGDEARHQYQHDRIGFYRRVRNGVQLALGLLRSTMLHDTPLDFIWLGVLLERVGQTARTLDVHHHLLTVLDQRNDIVETALWLSLMRACSGFEPFMKRHQGRVSGNAVANFLLFEGSFPRSIRYCARSAHERLCAIRPPTATDLPGGASLARLAALDAWVQARAQEPLEPWRIHDLLTHVVDETASTCNDLSVELFGAQRDR